jgi:hypothetical protein
MKSLAVVALALLLAPPVARAQQADTSSGSYGRRSPNKSKNSAGAKIGGNPATPPEVGSSTEGRARAGYDVGMASATAGGRTDTGPPVGEAETRKLSGDRDHAPSLARPTREEILEAQQRGSIRDRDEPDWIRGQKLTELELPNPFQVREVMKNPYRHRQDDLKP